SKSKDDEDVSNAEAFGHGTVSFEGRDVKQFRTVPARDARLRAVNWLGTRDVTLSDAITPVRRWLWVEWVLQLPRRRPPRAAPGSDRGVARPTVRRESRPRRKSEGHGQPHSFY